MSGLSVETLFYTEESFSVVLTKIHKGLIKVGYFNGILLNRVETCGTLDFKLVRVVTLFFKLPV